MPCIRPYYYDEATLYEGLSIVILGQKEKKQDRMSFEWPRPFFDVAERLSKSTLIKLTTPFRRIPLFIPILDVSYISPSVRPPAEPCFPL